jgi:hypothetical protein
MPLFRRPRNRNSLSARDDKQKVKEASGEARKEHVVCAGAGMFGSIKSSSRHLLYYKIVFSFSGLSFGVPMPPDFNSRMLRRQIRVPTQSFRTRLPKHHDEPDSLEIKLQLRRGVVLPFSFLQVADHVHTYLVDARQNPKVIDTTPFLCFRL